MSAQPMSRYSVLASSPFRIAYGVSFYTLIFVGLELTRKQPRVDVASRVAFVAAEPSYDTASDGPLSAYNESIELDESSMSDPIMAQALMALAPDSSDDEPFTVVEPPSEQAPESSGAKHGGSVVALEPPPEVSATTLAKMPNATLLTSSTRNRTTRRATPASLPPTVRRITYRSSRTGRLYYRYVSVAPRKPLSESMSLSPSSDKSSFDAAMDSAPKPLSNEEIRRRTAANKAKNRALARKNLERQRARRNTGAGKAPRPAINLAEYKALLAARYGINRLVQHHRPSASTAPFSMRHVGQHLGLGGGVLEGAGYSRRSPAEALAACSYSNAGMPILYQGVARGRDGYYAYKIYRR